MKTRKNLFLLLIFVLGLGACTESMRFESASNDKTPPGKPEIIRWEPLYGGARFFYKLPPDEDLLSVDAEYVAENGKTFHFTSSFYLDSLDVLGFGDMNPHKVSLYGVDRTGNRSEPVVVEITPKESAITRVLRSVVVKPGFSSFFVDWENELKQVINVYIHFKFTDSGTARDLISVFSSNMEKERRFINDLKLSPQDPIEISIKVEDIYGNVTEEKSYGSINLREDFELDKTLFHIPEANDSTVVLRNGTRVNAGVPAMFGNNLEGRMSKLIDGIIDRGDNLNFFHTAGRGRTGFSKDGNMPWNIIIDLGGYYRLSRISTVQRHSGGLDNISRGQYYRSENCGEFRLWVYNESTLQWDSISTQRTAIPNFINELQFVKAGEAGDMTYFYPDEPDYTQPTRWFRYEGLHCFDDNYSSTGANCMSELTLYGIKVE
ncbi:hypothetical protein AGMMS50239_31970 [Bacteroidia bacterium]|nr:hypothetical protein AGMMS50239_31970 [Bacteroidia bacterium]